MRNNNEEDKSLKETNYLLSATANRDRLLESIKQAEIGKIRVVDIDDLLKN